MSIIKRLTALFLAAAMLLGLPGCGGTSAAAPGDESVTFYYTVRGADDLESDETVRGEVRNAEILSLRDFVDLYLAGPESEELASPFPPGTEVLDIQYVSDVLTLKMSGAFFTMTGVSMSLAACCLTETVCGFMERDEIVLLDETESIRMELQPGQFLLSSSLQEEASESFTVYFPDSQYRYLIAESRDATLSRNESEAAYLIRKLLEGPESAQLEPVLPDGTELLSVKTEDGVCTVNLSYAFWENRPEDLFQNYLTVYAVVNTLTNIEGVDAVRFLVEGAAIEAYGAFPLSEPVARFGDCIGPARAASGEADVSLYMLGTRDGIRFPVPCRVRQTISQPLAEAVIATLLRYEPPQGFYNPIPYGTELLSVSVSTGVCYVDLSERFIPQEDTEEAEREAVWSLITSLTELSEINAVVLTIGGESTGLSYVDLSKPLTASQVALD